MLDILRWYCAYGPQEASLLVLVKPATRFPERGGELGKMDFHGTGAWAISVWVTCCWPATSCPSNAIDMASELNRNDTVDTVSYTHLTLPTKRIV